MLNKHYKKIPKDVLVFANRFLKTSPKGYEGKTFLLLLQNGREVLDEALYTYENGLFTRVECTLPSNRKDYPNFVGRHSFMFSQPSSALAEAMAYNVPQT